MAENAYRDRLRDGAEWAATHVGVGVTMLAGDSVSLRDGSRHRSVPMPEVCTLIRCDVDRKGNALTPEQARSRARTASTDSLPEARYNGLPRGSNRDPNWGSQWGKGGSFTLPTTTSSARLVGPRLQRFAKDVGMFDRT